MRYSKLFGKTSRFAPQDASAISYKLLFRSGYIRESTAGRYFFLPLGQKVQQNIMKIIKEEMDAAGAQEMVAPILHPLELWKETNRTNTAGFELMKIKDRRDAEFALGGTAEEMFVDVVRKFQLSYKDLPFNIYQFSNKFRDEMRARGGLLRVREFIMKDAYSFDVDEKAFKKEYEKMRNTYKKIFDRLSIPTQVVESDNGYIGGEYCHEFVMEATNGESKYFTTHDGSYTAHEEVAKFLRYKDLSQEELKERQDVEGVGIIGVADLAKFLHIPVEKTTKTILFENEKKEVIAAAVNGIYDINEVKLKNVLKCAQLTLATPDVVEKVTKAKVGYAGILNLPKNVRIIMDISLKGRINFECGANKTNYHSININFGRDISEPSEFYDIALAKAGYQTADGKQILIEKRGIEVGNIFQLGYHYSRLMKEATFIDQDGKAKPYYMGCYGIGIGRTMAAVVEKFHDEKGIIWPKAVTPFQVHLISIGKEQIDKDKADKLYADLLSKGIDVLFDDRDISPGEKFADADLIGIPIRLVISKKTGDKIEYKKRVSQETKLVSYEELLKLV